MMDTEVLDPLLSSEFSTNIMDITCKLEDVQSDFYQNNEILATLQFWNIKYSSTFSNFLSDLYAQVDNCHFLEKERMIRDKIVLSTSGKLQQKLVEENDLDLSKTVDICQLYEDMHLEESKLLVSNAEKPNKSLQKKNNVEQEVNINLATAKSQNIKGNFTSGFENLKNKANENLESNFEHISSDETTNKYIKGKISKSKIRRNDLDFSSVKQEPATNGNVLGVSKEISSLMSDKNLILVKMVKNYDTNDQSLENDNSNLPEVLKKKEECKKPSSKSKDEKKTKVLTRIEKSTKQQPKSGDEKHMKLLTTLKKYKKLPPKSSAGDERKKCVLLKPTGLLDIDLEDPETLKAQQSLFIKCPMCSKRFKSKAKYNGHYGEHFGVKTLPCKYCDKKFFDVYWRSRHEALKHGVENNYSPENEVCSICGIVFKRKGFLQRHIQHVHKKEKLFNCTVCNKSFSLQGNLNRHLLSHSNSKDFICDVCGKGFVDKVYLKNHKFTHSEERRYKCEVCGKMYKFSSHLRVHKLANHSDVRPYVCDRCGKGYVETRYFRKHKLRCNVDVL